MKDWLRRQVASRVRWRYELVGERPRDGGPDPWIIWLGRGQLRLEQGFYVTERAARRAALECPSGYTPKLMQMRGKRGDVYAVKRELPL